MISDIFGGPINVWQAEIPTKPHRRVFIFDICLTQTFNELVVGMGGITGDL